MRSIVPSETGNRPSHCLYVTSVGEGYWSVWNMFK